MRPYQTANDVKKTTAIRLSQMTDTRNKCELNLCPSRVKVGDGFENVKMTSPKTSKALSKGRR